MAQLRALTNIRRLGGRVLPGETFESRDAAEAQRLLDLKAAEIVVTEKAKQVQEKPKSAAARKAEAAKKAAAARKAEESKADGEQKAEAGANTSANMPPIDPSLVPKE
jgi:hypothetical protein